MIFIEEGATKNLLSGVPSIAEFLPQSLESLKLRGGFEDRVAAMMLHALAKRKTHRFQNLEEVAFDYKVDLGDELGEEFGKAGIWLDIKPRRVRNIVPSSDEEGSENDCGHTEDTEAAAIRTPSLIYKTIL